MHGTCYRTSAHSQANKSASTHLDLLGYARESPDSKAMEAGKNRWRIVRKRDWLSVELYCQNYRLSEEIMWPPKRLAMWFIWPG